jgi:hypothetical protein
MRRVADELNAGLGLRMGNTVEPAQLALDLASEVSGQLEVPGRQGRLQSRAPAAEDRFYGSPRA